MVLLQLFCSAGLIISGYLDEPAALAVKVKVSSGIQKASIT